MYTEDDEEALCNSYPHLPFGKGRPLIIAIDGDGSAIEVTIYVKGTDAHHELVRHSDGSYAFVNWPSYGAYRYPSLDLAVVSLLRSWFSAKDLGLTGNVAKEWDYLRLSMDRQSGFAGKVVEPEQFEGVDLLNDIELPNARLALRILDAAICEATGNNFFDVMLAEQPVGWDAPTDRQRAD